MNHSNNENQNKNGLNKNIKILNKSNNNSSSNSNSNSIYKKKNIVENQDIFMGKGSDKEEKDISPLKQIVSVTQKQKNNIFKKINKNAKSQTLSLNDTNKNIRMPKEEEENKVKLKSSIEKRKNNFASHSTIVLKKPKNTSPIIFSTKHNNKKRIKMDINYNSLNQPKDKENNDNSLNENNIRRANSFITNNKALNTINNNNSQNVSINKSQNEITENNNYKIIPKKK